MTARGGGVTSASSELAESESFGSFFADPDVDDASSDALSSDTTDDWVIECPKSLLVHDKVS